MISSSSTGLYALGNTDICANPEIKKAVLGMDNAHSNPKGICIIKAQPRQGSQTKQRITFEFLATL